MAAGHTAFIYISSGTSSVIADTMRRVRTSPPGALLGADVTVEDLLPDADVLRWRADGLRVVVRPSGTEPKLKAYLEAVDATGDLGAADARLIQLCEEVARLIGAQ